MIHIRQSMQHTLQIRAAESCWHLVVITVIAAIVPGKVDVDGAKMEEIVCLADQMARSAGRVAPGGGQLVIAHRSLPPPKFPLPLPLPRKPPEQGDVGKHSQQITNAPGMNLADTLASRDGALSVVIAAVCVIARHVPLFIQTKNSMQVQLDVNTRSPSTRLLP